MQDEKGRRRSNFWPISLLYWGIGLNSINFGNSFALLLYIFRVIGIFFLILFFLFFFVRFIFQSLNIIHIHCEAFSMLIVIVVSIWAKHLSFNSCSFISMDKLYDSIQFKMYFVRNFELYVYNIGRRNRRRIFENNINDSDSYCIHTWLFTMHLTHTTCI